MALHGSDISENFAKALGQAREVLGTHSTHSPELSEEIRAAMNSIHAAIASLPPESPARAKLEDALSGLESGHVAPNQAQTVLANVMQATQATSASGMNASSAAAFKASMINSVSGATVWATESAYNVLSNDEFFMSLDEENQKQIMQASAEAMDALESGDKEKIQAAKQKQAQAILDAGGTQEDVDRIWAKTVEKARENGVEVAQAATSEKVREAGGEAAATMREAQRAVLAAGGSETDVARIQSAASTEFTASAAETLEANGVSSDALRVDIALEQNEKAQAVLAADSSELSAAFVQRQALRDGVFKSTGKVEETSEDFINSVDEFKGVRLDIADVPFGEPFSPSAAPNLVAESNEVDAPAVS